MNIATVLCALLLLVMPAPPQSGFVLVVNAANPTESLTRDEVSRIFLKRQSKWAHGPAMTPVDLERTSSTREAFTKSVHARSTGAIASYWQQQIFSGREVPPPEMATEAEVLAHIRATPGAIGYVSAGASLGTGVRKVEVVK
jgi:ABC-type phosphate transport system substrate-binding protein